MRGDPTDYMDLVVEQCEREGHDLRTEGSTGAEIPVCRRCGTDTEKEQEQAA